MAGNPLSSPEAAVTSSMYARARDAMGGILRGRLARQAGWLLSGHLGVQVIRFVVNVILTRIIAPQLFGIMLLVNTLRTGIELISDVGIGQNIVRHREGMSAAFLNTAWTLQAVRGALLMLVGLALAVPFGRLYGDPLLGYVFAACALMFLIDGLMSPGRFVFQRTQRIRELALFEFVLAIVNAVLNVLIISMMRNIWGLVTALLVTGLVNLAASFWMMPLRSLSLRIDRHFLMEILHFGKWIFVSSIVYFLSMNFDRLYLGTAIPLTVLGVYGIARTISDALVLVANRAGSLMIFPKIAHAHNEDAMLRPAIGRVRLKGMVVVAAGMAVLLAVSDQMIVVLYDHRYHAAAYILPLLLVGAWFCMLATLADAVLLGIGKPGSTAAANAAKFVWLATAVPLALGNGSLTWALLAISAADIVRYVALTAANARHGLSFVRQDIAHTALLVVLAVLIRAALHSVGLVPGYAEWWAMGAALR